MERENEHPAIKKEWQLANYSGPKEEISQSAECSTSQIHCVKFQCPQKECDLTVAGSLARH